MDQNPNTPPSNRNPNPNSPLGFGQYEGYMNLLQTSPQIPYNQPFYNPNSPQMHFPQSPHFQQNIFSQSPQFVPSTQQTQNYFGQGSSMPQFVPSTQQSQQQEEDVVEVQEPTGRRGRGKGRAKACTKTKDAQTNQLRWTKDEEVALAESWCAMSVNPIVGNSQKGHAFWESIVTDFHLRVGKDRYRNNDGLSSKWRDMNRKCTKFNGIFNNLNGQKQSGTNHFDLYKVALERYQLEEGTPFTSTRAWEVLRVNAKWIEVHSFSQSQSKRSKSNTSNDVSDARTNIDLNDDNDEFPDVEPLPRPPGRDKSKRATAHAASSQASAATLEHLTKRLDDHLELQKTNVDLKRRQQDFLEQQEAARLAHESTMRDLDILKMSPDGFEGENLEAFLALQRKIRARFMS